MVNVKVQKSGETNVYINIPKDIREAISLEKGDTVCVEFNKKTGEIRINKVK